MIKLDSMVNPKKDPDSIIKEIEGYLDTGAKYNKDSWVGGSSAKRTVNMVRGIHSDRGFVKNIISLCNLQEEVIKKELRMGTWRKKSRTIRENLVKAKKIKKRKTDATPSVHQEAGFETVRNDLKVGKIQEETLEKISLVMRKGNYKLRYPPGKDAISKSVENAKGISLSDTPKGKPLTPLGFGDSAVHDLVGVSIMLLANKIDENIKHLNGLKKFGYEDFVTLALTRQMVYSLPGKYMHNNTRENSKEIPPVLADYVNKSLDDLDRLEKKFDRVSGDVSAAEEIRKIVLDKNSFLQKIGKKREFTDLRVMRETVNDLLG